MNPGPDDDTFDHAQLIPRITVDDPLDPEATRMLTTAQPAGSPPPDLPKKDSAKTDSPKRRSLGRRILRVLVVLLCILLVYGLLLMTLVLTSVERVDATPGGDRPAQSQGKTWLLVGSDDRSNLSEEEQQELSTGGGESRLADTIMMLYTAPGAPASLISIPRDSYVAVPGYGMQKINASYAYGGPKLLRETVELATGVYTDGYVEVGFEGFSTIVDAVGGVEICLDEPLQDPRAGLDLPAGCQTLDGAEALGYVRTRYEDPNGDLGRVERQREFLAALADEVLSLRLWLNPLRSVPFARAVGDALTIDEEMGIISTARFGTVLLRAVGGRGESLTVPVGGYADTDVGNVVLWDEALTDQLWEAMSNGDPIPEPVLSAGGG